MARDSPMESPELEKAAMENYYKDDYLASVDSTESALIRLRELLQRLRLSWLKVTTFFREVQDLADRIDISLYYSERKVFHSSKEE